MNRSLSWDPASPVLKVLVLHDGFFSCSSSAQEFPTLRTTVTATSQSLTSFLRLLCSACLKGVALLRSEQRCRTEGPVTGLRSPFSAAPAEHTLTSLHLLLAPPLFCTAAGSSQPPLLRPSGPAPLLHSSYFPAQAKPCTFTCANQGLAWAEEICSLCTRQHQYSFCEVADGMQALVE